MPRRFFTLDVFTSVALAGNPLAVVMDADDLDTAAMQVIAGEFNLSETIFVMKPTASMHNASVRIFTPGKELPFAGHPTVGVAALLAFLKFGDQPGEQDAMVLIEEKIGLVRAGVKLVPGKAPYAVFDLPKLPEEAGTAPTKTKLAHALGLMESDLCFDNHQPMQASAGVPFVYVPVRNREALKRCRVNQAYWGQLFAEAGSGAAYVYCRDAQEPGHHFRARMFAPSMGISEDPATGAAAAGFAAVLERFEPLPDGMHQFVIEQGYEMGRPSQISLEVELAGGALKIVRIGGHAVLVQEGTLLAV